MDRKSRAIYWYQYGELLCYDKYIGETSGTFGERYKEHLKEPSPMSSHSKISGHITNPDNFTIIGREDHGLAKLSMNLSTYGLTAPHSTGIWVSKTYTIYGTELRIIKHNGHVHSTPISGHAEILQTNSHAHRTIEHLGHAQRTPPSEYTHRTS